MLLVGARAAGGLLLPFPRTVLSRAVAGITLRLSVHRRCRRCGGPRSPFASTPKEAELAFGTARQGSRRTLRARQKPSAQGPGECGAPGPLERALDHVRQ